MSAFLWDHQSCASLGHSTASWHADHVAIDTRTMLPNSLFVALKGESHDGHDFLQEAQHHNAAAAMVEQLSHSAVSLPLLHVDNCSDAMIRMAHRARERSSARIIAITGSVGKTTTKEMLATILNQQGQTSWAAASHNNKLGVSLSLANLRIDDDFAVFELGMNHAGEIRELSHWVKPHLALITSIAPAHSAFFNSLREICEAKSEIMENLEKNAVVILPKVSPFYETLAQKAEIHGAKIISFGRNPEADFRLLDDNSILHKNQQGKLNLRWQGSHNHFNALAAIAAAQECGVAMATSLQILSDIEPLKGRGREHRLTINGSDICLLDESYNANPASMKAALVNLGDHAIPQGGRRIAILGDMLELGKEEVRHHEDVASYLSLVDKVHCVGERMEHLYRLLPPKQQGFHGHDIASIEGDIIADFKKGDVVMVKGSASMRLAELVANLCQKGEIDAV